VAARSSEAVENELRGIETEKDRARKTGDIVAFADLMVRRLELGLEYANAKTTEEMRGE